MQFSATCPIFKCKHSSKPHLFLKQARPKTLAMKQSSSKSDEWMIRNGKAVCVDEVRWNCSSRCISVCGWSDADSECVWGMDAPAEARETEALSDQRPGPEPAQSLNNTAFQQHHLQPALWTPALPSMFILTAALEEHKYYVYNPHVIPNPQRGNNN